MIVAALTAMALDSNCPGPNLTIEGEYRFVESRHPNGTELKYGFVVTTDPVCVAISAETTEAVSGRWIQVSWAEDQKERPRPGDSVVVRAECFEPHTAWHLGEIICINAHLISREPM
jgi:hypothetical protein